MKNKKYDEWILPSGKLSDNKLLRRAKKAEAELAALRHDMERQQEINAELATECERLREHIRAAPHASGCLTVASGIIGNLECNCWKAEALRAAVEE